MSTFLFRGWPGLVTRRSQNRECNSTLFLHRPLVVKTSSNSKPPIFEEYRVILRQLKSLELKFKVQYRSPCHIHTARFINRHSDVSRMLLNEKTLHEKLTDGVTTIAIVCKWAAQVLVVYCISMPHCTRIYWRKFCNRVMLFTRSNFVRTLKFDRAESVTTASMESTVTELNMRSCCVLQTPAVTVAFIDVIATLHTYTVQFECGFEQVHKTVKV